MVFIGSYKPQVRLADVHDAITGMRHDLTVFVHGCAHIRKVRLRGLDRPYRLSLAQACSTVIVADMPRCT